MNPLEGEEDVVPVAVDEVLDGGEAPATPAATEEVEIDLLNDDVPTFAAMEEFLKAEGMEGGFKVSKATFDAMPDDAKKLYHNVRAAKDRAVTALTEKVKALEAQQGAHRQETAAARAERLRVAKVYAAAANTEAGEDKEPDVNADPKAWLKWTARQEARAETAKFGTHLTKAAKDETDAIAREEADALAEAAVTETRAWFAAQTEAGVSKEILQLVDDTFADELKGTVPLDTVLDLVLLRLQRGAGEQPAAAVRRAAALRPSGTVKAPVARPLPTPPKDADTSGNIAFFGRNPDSAQAAIKRVWG